MNLLKKILLTLSLAVLPSLVAAQAPAPAAAPAAVAPAPTAPSTGAEAKPAPAVATPAATPATGAAAPDATKPAPAKSMDGSMPGYTPMKPTEGVGMPRPKEIDFQDQYSDLGKRAYHINNYILLPIITVISLFVLLLLLFVIVRFRRGANPEPSKTTHHTWLEILWTGIPVLILLFIAVPSIDLLAKQFKPAPANAVTIKATGYQWYWTYTYPDHGGFEVTSNMLKEKADVGPGERYRTDNDGPSHLAADERMVVPAGVPLRIQTTAADVIHAFAVPSLWFKIDAVPGRLNEKTVTITKPGVYFGQCSELCGARHGFMPIAVEALPPEKFAAWVKAKGGTMPGEKKAAAAAPAAGAAPAAAAPAAPATTDKAAPAAAPAK